MVRWLAGWLAGWLFSTKYQRHWSFFYLISIIKVINLNIQTQYINHTIKTKIII
jgi:hypothetical protein